MVATSPRAARTEQRGPRTPTTTSPCTKQQQKQDNKQKAKPLIPVWGQALRSSGSWFAEHRDAQWPCSDQKISLTLKSVWNLDRQHWGRGSKPWREDWKLLLTPGKPWVFAMERLEAVWGAVWGMIPLHCSKCRVQPYCTLSIRVSNAGLSFGDICQFRKRHPRG